MARYAYLKDLFHPYIEDDSELDEFGLWAFGDDLREMFNGIEFLNAWNTIHGNDLLLNETNRIENDAPLMVDLWMKHKNA